MRVIIIAVTTALLIAFFSHDAICTDMGRITPSAEPVSMINLIANPDRWNGKVVGVTGVMILEFEGDALYLSKSDADNNVFKNAIWIDINYPQFGIPDKEPADPTEHQKAIARAEELKRIIGHYVYIEGKYDKTSNGHLGLFSGTLSVTRIAKFN